MKNSMQKISPYLWFDDKAEEAVNFYTSLFKNSKIGNLSRYGAEAAEVSGRPEGTVMTVAFELEGQEFIALNGGPQFNFTPAVSFFVGCEKEEEIDELWGKLSDGGEILMPIQEYPFSDKFGWINDKFGVSWQLNLASDTQKITPFLMFVGDQHGKAEAAMNFYVSLFKNSGINNVMRYGSGEEEPEGTVMHAKFSLGGQIFMAMDSSREHHFTFTEAISFQVNCKTQEEVDHFWERFTAAGEEGPCGWLKDQFGVSWQIVPTALLETLNDPDPEKSQRVMQAMLQMKKLDIRTLEEAYEQ